MRVNIWGDRPPGLPPNSQRIVPALIVSLALCSGVQAGPFEDGVNAFQQGNYATALREYRKAAEQGHALAQNNLGLMYDMGQGVEQDYKEAFRWYSMAAKQEYPLAQYNLGIMYQAGLGIDKNIDQAITLYQMAASQGHADARRQLSKLLSSVSGGKKSNSTDIMHSPGKITGQSSESAAGDAGEEGVGTTDYFNVQVYSMPSQGKMHIVDFRYDSKGACMTALAKRKNMYAVQQPEFEVVKEHCTTMLSAKLAKMMGNEKAGWPYFTFQDMRQWIDGVDRSVALEFCHETAKSPGFLGGTRCIE